MTKKIAISLNLDSGLTRYMLMFQGIQAYAKKHADWSLFWDHYPEVKLRNGQSHETPAYDGIIGRIKVDAYNEAKRLDIPCVNLWHNSSLMPELPSVLDDFKEAGRLAAKHLQNRGFKELTMIDCMDTSAKEFLLGVKEVLKPMKYSVKTYKFNRKAADSPAAWERQMAIFEKWAKEWTFPMAVICSMNNIAIPTFCKTLGIRIPEDLALIMCSSEENSCEICDPSITSVGMNFWRRGYEAARMLHQQLEGELLKETHQHITPTGVTPRESTDTHSTEDEVVQQALRYIADNISQEIHVGNVVDHVKVSRSSLEIRFKNTTDSTIKDEVNRLRIICVKRLLADENLKIKDIYEKAGFSSALHLRRVFSKIVGVTPGQYRQSLNEPE